MQMWSVLEKLVVSVNWGSYDKEVSVMSHDALLEADADFEPFGMYYRGLHTSTRMAGKIRHLAEPWMRILDSQHLSDDLLPRLQMLALAIHTQTFEEVML